jgi:hypothetical protein
MDRYFNVYEKQTPEFVARVWLGDAFVCKAEFMGRSVDSQEVDVPMSFLLQNPGKNISPTPEKIIMFPPKIFHLPHIFPYIKKIPPLGNKF